MRMRSMILCLSIFLCSNMAMPQTMNIQTQTGIVTIRLSDIVNITFTESENEMVTDYDGNTYRTVKIGDQIWMAENLKVTKYRNGEAIPNVTDNNEWANLTTGAYSNYNNDVNNVATYGRLYNWYAVFDSRNIAPAGWHMPKDAEWQTLVDYLGGNSIAGGKMKTTGTIEGGDGMWLAPNTSATNERGFSALPGGYRYFDGYFSYMGFYAYFWSAPETSSYAAYRSLSYDGSDVYGDYCSKQRGLSVRLVRD